MIDFKFVGVKQHHKKDPNISPQKVNLIQRPNINGPSTVPVMEVKDCGIKIGCFRLKYYFGTAVLQKKTHMSPNLCYCT